MLVVVGFSEVGKSVGVGVYGCLSLAASVVGLILPLLSPSLSSFVPLLSMPALPLLHRFSMVVLVLVLAL